MPSFSIVANRVLVGLGSFGNWLYGCAHRHTSFPITLRADFGMGQPETYIVCLACGQRLAYDWNAMCRSKKPAEAHREVSFRFPARFVVNCKPKQSGDIHFQPTAVEIDRSRAPSSVDAIRQRGEQY